MTSSETVFVLWECGECNRKESQKEPIRSVCHHCGKPLCNEHRVLIEDDAFSPTAGSVERTASHCTDCRERHHPRSLKVTGRRAQ